MVDINENEIVPLVERPPVFQAMDANAARLNVTWSGQNGHLPDPVPLDATDEELRTMVTEALVNGYIPGIEADADVDLAGFVVNRYAATDDIPYARVFLRPKTPFGAV
jgi:hypothetical protein